MSKANVAATDAPSLVAAGDRACDALATAIGRCPEHAEELHRVRELAWAARLYSQSRAQMKHRYDELSEECSRLKRSLHESERRVASITDRLTALREVLQCPVAELDRLRSTFEDMATWGDDERTRALREGANRLQAIMNELARGAAVLDRVGDAMARTPLTAADTEIPITFAHRPSDVSPGNGADHSAGVARTVLAIPLGR